MSETEKMRKMLSVIANNVKDEEHFDEARYEEYVQRFGESFGNVFVQSMMAAKKSNDENLHSEAQNFCMQLLRLILFFERK